MLANAIVYITVATTNQDIIILELIISILFSVSYAVFGAYIYNLDFGAKEISRILAKAEIMGKGAKIKRSDFDNIQHTFKTLSRNRIDPHASIIPLEEFKIIKERKLYLIDELNIFSLAKMMNVGVNELNSSIHYHFMTNFAGYIDKITKEEQNRQP